MGGWCIGYGDGFTLAHITHLVRMPGAHRVDYLNGIMNEQIIATLCENVCQMMNSLIETNRNVNMFQSHGK